MHSKSIVRPAMNSKTNFFDLNPYVLEHILSFLEIDDIKTISNVNKLGYTITNNYFETMCVLSLPELITSDIVELFNDSKRRYKCAVYKLSRKIKGNILDCLKELPFKTIIKATFYWENIDELPLDQLKDFELELFPSQIAKAHTISNHVTKINFSHKPLLVLSDISAKFPNLKELHLTNVKDDSVFYEQEVITRPTNLKIVKISWGSFLLTSALLNLFKGLTVLEFKFLEDIELIKMLIENNKATLKHLVVQLTTPEIAEMSIPCQLTHLEIYSKNDISLKGILRQQRNLRYLVLESALIDDFLIHFLENSNVLQHLSLNDPIYQDANIISIQLPNVISFHGNVNNLIPISDKLKCLQTEKFNDHFKLNHLSELKLMSSQVSVKPHLKFDSFEDFKDYHISEPLNPRFLKNISATRLRVEWIISLNEFKKFCVEVKQLELFHFRVRPKDLHDFYNYLDPSSYFGKLRFVVFSVQILNVHEICIVQKVLNNSIDERLLGDFFRPFYVFVDIDFKNTKRNIFYFSS